jgi:hypothetical protein
MRALGGAFWPLMTIRYINKDGSKRTDEQIQNTIEHEEAHMIEQLMLGIIPFYLLYGIFLITHGYLKNPFEVWARIYDVTGEWKPYGWINYI